MLHFKFEALSILMIDLLGDDPQQRFAHQQSALHIHLFQGHKGDILKATLVNHRLTFNSLDSLFFTFVMVDDFLDFKWGILPSVMKHSEKSHLLWGKNVIFSFCFAN